MAHRYWASGLVSRASPPHVQRGCVVHSSGPRLRSWASPSLSAVRPFNLKCLLSGVAVGFRLPIIPDIPAVAVGLGPVGFGTSSDDGDCLLSPTPPQLRGRMWMLPFLYRTWRRGLPGSGSAISKNTVRGWRCLPASRDEVLHTPCQLLKMQRRTAFSLVYSSVGLCQSCANRDTHVVVENIFALI